MKPVAVAIANLRRPAVARMPADPVISDAGYDASKRYGLALGEVVRLELELRAAIREKDEAEREYFDEIARRKSR